jgi:two-component system, LytTR family, sensor kinase
LVESAIYLTVVMVVGTELKIFNSVRIQMKLEEQERLLLQARMEALQNQINPHFLFNTLNSISSLVRFDPDTAREMILKLAAILRRLLHSADSFVPLREEVEFIDNYLDIEVVRFGRDKLKVSRTWIRRLSKPWFPACCCSRWWKTASSTDLLQSRRRQHYAAQPADQIAVVVEVEDDGVGMGAAMEQPDGFGGAASAWPTWPSG